MESIETNSEIEDETDICTLQYHEADPSLLGTAVFIKAVQLDPGDRVLVYKHDADMEDEARIDTGKEFPAIIFLVFFALATLTLYSWL